MGAIAEALVAYAQPLIDQTDGSVEDMDRALSLSSLCFTLAQVPEGSRDEFISKVRFEFDKDDEEFEEFKSSIILPMIRRHEEMFPQMHRRFTDNHSQVRSSRNVPSPHFDSLPAGRGTAIATESHPAIDRYAPCPCNSGRKYKFCCGKTGR